MATKKMRTVPKFQYCHGVNVFFAQKYNNDVDIEQRADSPVLVIPAKGVDFRGCEKVVKTITKDLDSLGYRRVVFRCDKEPSTLALLRAVLLAWQWGSTRNVCRGRHAVQRRCRRFGKKRHQMHVRSVKLAVESAAGVEVPADYDLLICDWSRLEDGVRNACECVGCRCSPQPVV